MIEFKIVDNIETIFQVAKLAHYIWNQHYLPMIGSEQVNYMLDKFQSEDAIKQQIDRGYKYYIIFNEQQEAGYFSVKVNDQAEKLFLSKLYVLKSFRGKGIGKQAIKFIKTNFYNPVIQLTVNKNNSRSIAFYKNIGFEIVDDVVTDIGSGFVMDDYIMEMQNLGNR
ncbi:GNAT family N-acetyltransferase [Calothrix sp. CCY 0018]|uniref:GNAT family N-acetyltransferase n=1 Tax=Calothrix sp. CCY 0018 TaxID=3103864 RepID=UPI0039C65A11